MEQILVYSDSLSWGIIPGTRGRLAFEQRWPGVLEQSLISQGRSVRVIENCLNGRRTAWDDPFKPGRDGSDGLAQVIEMHSPLSLVILMLGNNDFQSTHSLDAVMSVQGNAKLINTIRQAPIEPGMPVPPILLVAPPVIRQPKGAMADKFVGAAERSRGFNQQLQKLAQEQDCLFFDSNPLIHASPIDGIHLDQSEHQKLGLTLAEFIAKAQG
ncbi:SGNH/GDSL hydrolase family protein [Motiliproteus sp.]|uniref:SGNH/GDSL hydrolase family protein n=1 Tax=Motiliproteus sp. TaxID=1898955 RepID=UPI003BA90C73